MNDFISIASQPSVSAAVQFMILLPLLAGLALFCIPEKLRLYKGLITLVVSILKIGRASCRERVYHPV